MTHWITGVKRDGDIELQSGSEGLELGFTEHYHVLADSKDVPMWDIMRDAVPTAEATPYLPVNGLPLPSVTVARDGICVCKSLTGSREEGNPLKWTFTAIWSSKVEFGSGTQGQGGSPTVDPTLIGVARETMFEMVQRNKLIDKVGQPYVNGAGTIFNPPLTVDEELLRWDFAQFEPVYKGSIDSTASTIQALTGTYGELTEADISGAAIYPPAIYKKSGGSWILAGVTDTTVAYFNGAINAAPFKGRPAYTLKLKVRKSTEHFYYGRVLRLSHYSIVYDPENWFDKPLNAGPFFTGPALSEDGQFEDFVNPVTYPYIYYTKDKEDPETPLALDNAGPLGERDLTLSFDETKKGLILPDYDWQQDAVPTAGYQKIQTHDGKWTLRANRISTPLKNNAANGTRVNGKIDSPLHYIEFVNSDLLDFNSYIRVN